MQSRSRTGLLLKKKLIDTEGVAQLSAQIGQLKLPSTDGKMYETDVASMTTVLRIIQSIPSKNAESFKDWLAPEEATRWPGRSCATVPK
jgi:hypothetical protein